ncbi:MAG: hypothetical protein GWO04_39900, partial [Actinobacteria bacterium]|nr:hypothetical protein [Actinomycetota bacterium]
MLVACRGSHAVAVVDPAGRRVRALIQDRDPDGRPLLQEPAGMVVDGSRLYVVSSQNRRLAIVDLVARQVLRYIELPGQEPRSLALTPDGRFLVVADFLAGNRTEPDLAFHPGVFDPEDPAGAFCRSLLLDNPDTLELIQESGPRFMDTADPDYAAAAECYFYAHAFGATSRIVVEPRRADHDLVVVDLERERVAFTSDRLSDDLGSVNYAVAVSPDGNRVYLASTLARNFLNRKFGLRPLVNRLSVLALDRASGALSVVAIRDLDEGVLTEDGGGRSQSAIPHALAVDAERVWLVAAGSDRLWIADRDGQPIESLPVKGTPKGLAVTGDTAFVYEAGSRSVSRRSLTRDDAVSASIGPTP